MILAYQSPSGFKIVGSNGGNRRDLFMNCYFMEPGQYYLFVEIDWASEESNREFVMSSYGVAPIGFYGIDSGYVPYQDKKEFLK
jgi:hypothetical protein